MDRILITGGLGYVGRRVAKTLSEKKDTFLLLGTRKPQKAPDWLKQGQVLHLDVLSEKSVQASCWNVKKVIHLAAANEIESSENPQLAVKVNTLGTLLMLQAAAKAGVERFIYFSTAHVYGAPLQGDITEETLPRPVHPYAITHRAAEDFIFSAHDKGILTGVILRLSNGFGVPACAEVNQWTLVVNDFCRQAVTTQKLVLRSSGLQWRDFIPLSDVCRAVEHFLFLPAPACCDGLFNLGGGCSLRIIDMVQLIAQRCQKVLGFRPEIHRPEPSEKDVTDSFHYKIDKLKNTGFKLEGSAEDEIDATLRLCKEAFG